MVDASFARTGRARFSSAARIVEASVQAAQRAKHEKLVTSSGRSLVFSDQVVHNTILHELKSKQRDNELQWITKLKALIENGNVSSS